MPLYQGNHRVKVHLDSNSFNMNIPDLIVGQFVLDFGLPIELVVDSEYSIQSVEENTMFGTAELGSNNTIIYTPSKVLTGYDVIHAKTDAGVSAYVRIYPANNVLYEETFATVDENSGWKQVDTANANTTQKVSGDDDVYGYDAAYAKNNDKYSNGSAYKATVVTSGEKPKATFSFKGDGLEVISECGPQTGGLYIRVTNALEEKNADGTVSYFNRVYIVDTYFNGTLVSGSSEVAVNDSTLYQVPVVHALGLADTDHDVTVYAYYLENSGATMAQNAQVAVQLASDGTESMSYGSDLDAILAEMGDEGAEVEYISMNEVLGGSDDGVSLYATQVYDANETSDDLVVYLDGFRVYNTLDTGPSAYVESKAEFITSKKLLQNSSYDENTLISTGCVMCSELQSEDLEIFTDVESWPYMFTGSCYICKIPNKCDVQLEVSTPTDFCTVFGLDDVDNLTSQTPMYCPAKCIETASGRFFVLNNTSSSNGVCGFYGIKILNGKFEYLSYTKEDILEVLNVVYAESNNVLQSADGYYLQDSNGTYLQYSNS